MKIMMGVVGMLTLAVGLLTWQLRGAWQSTSVAEARVAQVERERDEREREVAKQQGRWDTLDLVLAALEQGNRDTRDQLDKTLAAIDGIEITEGDSIETISCLDLRVPAQLDDSLR